MTHDEREWQAQERALREERLSTDTTTDDARLARYRLIVRALRQSSPPDLPANFAAGVARIAAAQTHEPHADTRLERLLMNLLMGTLAVSGAITIAIYGGDWLHAFARLAPTSHGATLGWGLALAACVGLSWMAEHLRGHSRHA